MNKRLIDLANKIHNKKWFGRRHYEAIADTLYYAVKMEQHVEGVEYSILCDELATLFGEDNPLFKPEKFMDRCGVDVWSRGMINVPNEIQAELYGSGNDNISLRDMESDNG